MPISKMHLVTAFLLSVAATTAGAQQTRQSVHTDGENKQSVADVYGEPKTRAEVRADLELWKRAGMKKLYRGHPDTFSPKYKAAYAEYVRLRSGPEYQQEVQRQLAK